MQALASWRPCLLFLLGATREGATVVPWDGSTRATIALHSLSGNCFTAHCVDILLLLNHTVAISPQARRHLEIVHVLINQGSLDVTLF